MAGWRAAPPALAGCGLGCVRLLFEYLNMLRQAGPQQWAYEEMAAIAGMKFRWGAPCFVAECETGVCAGCMREQAGAGGCSAQRGAMYVPILPWPRAQR